MSCCCVSWATTTTTSGSSPSLLAVRVVGWVLLSCLVSGVLPAVNITDGGFVYKNSALIPELAVHELSLTFVTTKHNGLLFYGNNEKAFFSMELYYGSVRISGNFSNQRTRMPFIGFAGYGLADGKPHQVEFYKRSQEIMVIVDRGTTKRDSYIVSSNFLNDIINFDESYVGNHPELKSFDNFQSITKTNFVGCIQEATWNSLDMLSDAYSEMSVPACGETVDHNPITFLYMDSYIMMYRSSNADGFDLEFDLLVYQNFSTIISHKVNDTKFELIVIEGRLQMTVYIENNIVINAITIDSLVSDGSWHKVKIFLPGKSSSNKNVIFRVDDFLTDSPSPIFYNAGKNIKFGGFGFIGCIDNVRLDRKSYHLEKYYQRKGISTNGCNITFQCNPNPCINAGNCLALQGLEYACLCNGNTTGFNCEKPIAPPTCSEIHKAGFKRDGAAIIDADGIGLFDPIWVNCFHMNSFDSDRAVTVVKPIQSSYNLIDSPRSWEIYYNVSTELLNTLAAHSIFCKQTVTYQCTRSRITRGNITLMNWVGGDGRVHNYWNSRGIYGKCECSIRNNTCFNDQNCNCDNYDTTSRVDRTELQFKTDLPIIRINPMNISSKLGSSAKLEVGDFFCQGIGGKLNMVTFAEVFSFLEVESLNLWNAGSFEIDFKTDQARGNILLYARGRISKDYILLYLKNPTTVTVEVNLGTFTHYLDVSILSKAPSNFEDLEFHSVLFAISRRGFNLTVDKLTSTKSLENNVNTGILLNLDNLPTYIGGTPFDPFSGFRGTVRNFRINGQPYRLFEKARNESIVGVVPGGYAACISVANPCNSGRCIDHFNYYVCNCDYCPYYGSHCQTEKGLSMRGGDFAIAYSLDSNLVLTEWFISVGFVTTNASATLFSLISENTDVFFLGNMVDGVFGVYYHFRNDISFQSRSYIIEHSDLGYYLNNGELHIIKVEFRSETLFVNIDNRPFLRLIEEYTTERTTFQEPSAFYLGGAIMTSLSISELDQYTVYPFLGCITGGKLLYKAKGIFNRVLVDPVDLFYMGSSMVQVGQVTKTNCGLVNFTVAGNAPLIPYPPNPVAGDTSSVERRVPLGDSWGSTLLGLGVFLFILIILIVIFILKWYSRNIGCYQTEEGNLAKTGNVVGIMESNSLGSEDESEHSPLLVEPHEVIRTETGYI